jgi:DNA repair protein RadD
MITLRPDQADLKRRIYEAWQNGARNVLAIAPTGSGKTVLSTDIILDGHNQGLTECIMAHRNELVGQMSLAVAERGIPHRIIGSKSTIAGIVAEHRAEFGRSFYNPDARCAVGSVQTIMSRIDELRSWGQQVNRWTLDESHHLLKGNTWGKAVELFPNAFGLGVTACPSRADGNGLGRHHEGLFDAMCVGPTMRELIDMGALSEYEIIVPVSDYEIGDDAITAKGDFSPVKMREASKKSHIVGDVVAEYQRWVNGKRAICFATDVETSNEIASRFNEAGIPAASVSAKTDTGVRRDMIRRFKDGRIQVLVNVDLFDEGFNVPACEVVIMARPTASLNKFLQMFGRAMRVFPGKTTGWVIDHVSNWKRHGLPDRPRLWTLDRRDKRSRREPDPDDIPLTACRSCSRPYERCLPACPYCGEAPPVPEGGARSIEQVDGDLMLLDRATLAAMRAAMQLEAPGDVAERVGAVAGPVAAAGAVNRQMERHASQERLKQAIEQWAGVRRAAGESDQSILRRFYLTTGVDVLTAMAGKRAEMDALAAKVEGWYQV